MAMLRISTKLRKLMESHKTRWVPVDGLPELAFDHRDIICLLYTSVLRGWTAGLLQPAPCPVFPGARTIRG